MQLKRITVTLEPGEREALIDLAHAERRDPRAQAAYIIRQALGAAGLLPANKTEVANE